MCCVVSDVSYDVCCRVVCVVMMWFLVCGMVCGAALYKCLVHFSRSLKATFSLEGSRRTASCHDGTALALARHTRLHPWQWKNSGSLINTLLLDFLDDP